MDHNLEIYALHWLAYERRCECVLFERTPRSVAGSRPDVLGVTKSRYLIEVEIKRSLSDFRADAHKLSRKNRELYLKRFPKQFYYFVLPEIKDAVASELPEWAGLATVPKNGWGLEVVKVAPNNPHSQRLSLREYLQLFRAQTNQLIAAEKRVAELRAWNTQDTDWGLDYRI